MASGPEPSTAEKRICDRAVTQWRLCTPSGASRVEAHGGSISVESSTGGTAFAFSIPIAAPDADPPGRAAGEDLELGDRRGGGPSLATAPGEQRGGVWRSLAIASD